MDTKLIITNRKRLRYKYGTIGLHAIEAKLKKLIAADKARGLKTDLVAMDIQNNVGPRAAPKITNPEDPQETKNCIDALYENAKPDYLMILGAPDVVCHQPLVNPVTEDEDLDVPSDLPYACDAGFSDEISDFIGATRVVGRLPDITGESDPAALLSALDTLTVWKKRSPTAYNSYCAISTDAWKKSTRQSVKKIFNKSNVQFISPNAGQPWSKHALKPRMHLINCHGGSFDTAFYGDDGQGGEPLTIDQADYHGRLREGSVIAAECCYGAELYDAPMFSMPPGICNSAMTNGVYGYLGSTNIAYGPADSNGCADLMCLNFLHNVKNGASIGRALLEARQRYCDSEAPLNPVDLKTLGQFLLIGDPSVHPAGISKKVASVVAKSKSGGSTRARRRKLRRKGLLLASRLAHVYSKMDKQLDGGLSDFLTKNFKSSKLKSHLTKMLQEDRYSVMGKIQSFAVQEAQNPSLAKSKSAIRKAVGTGHYLMVGASDSKRKKTDRAYPSPKKTAVKRGPDMLMVALEQEKNIENVKMLYRR